MDPKYMMPKTLEEALAYLDQRGKDIQLLAGGTDLVIDLRRGKKDKDILMSIGHLKGLQFIVFKTDEVFIGAGTKFTDIVENERIKKEVYGFWKACKSVGSLQVRNMASIGGNICNRSTAADSVPPLLVLDAKLMMISKNGNKIISLKDFYEDQKSICENEMLYAIKFQKPKKGEGMGFEKLGLRKALTISRISCAVSIKIHEDKILDIKIATGALGKYPLREPAVEELLKNRKISEMLLNEALQKMSCSVEERLKGRSSMSFKKEAVKGVFKKAFRGAVKGAYGNEKNSPDY